MPPRRPAPPLHLAETIAVGSELLVGGRTDSNSLRIAEEFGRLGIAVRFKSIVGDDRKDIRTAVGTAARRAGVIVLTGGLGPTVDDCTREAVADVTGRRLTLRKDASEALKARLAEWGRIPNAGQRRQALIPAGATVIRNPVGSAPGFWMKWNGALLISLPGVPWEMEAMLRDSVLALLASELTDAGASVSPLTRLVFHTFGLPEAEVDAKLKGFIKPATPVDLGLLASPMGVLVSLTTRPSPPLSKVMLQRLADGVRSRLADWLYTEGQDSMEEVVGRLLTEQHKTVAVAESCTGGLIGHRLTQVPGSSAYVDCGVMCYSNRAKTDLLGVSPLLIARHGAVSAEVASAMARGMRERSGVSVALSVTGIAGPGGGTATKPVGLVYLGLDTEDGRSITKEYRFSGDRSVVKQRASQAALDVLRRWLLERAEPA
ncbi:MAG: competence/damage-inducible protein A [Nitrospira sp.]|nr:competence/damage-inducible protein A [Nitrospira sp.]